MRLSVRSTDATAARTLATVVSMRAYNSLEMTSSWCMASISSGKSARVNSRHAAWESPDCAPTS